MFSETYSNYFGKSPYERIKLSKLDLSKLPIEGLTQLECGGQGADIDTAWNEEQTPAAARLAAGCMIEAAVSVAKGKLLNAFAVVRPPGKIRWRAKVIGGGACEIYRRKHDKRRGECSRYWAATNGCDEPACTISQT